MKDAFRLATRALLRVEEYVVVVTGLTACVVIMTSAFMRYVLSKDFYGAEELIILCAFWLYFIGSALASREDSHLTADLLVSLIKTQRRKAALNIVRHGLSLIISLLVTFWTYKYIVWILHMGPHTPVLKFPTIFMQIPIFICFILMNLYILGHLISDIRVLSARKEEPA